MKNMSTEKSKSATKFSVLYWGEVKKSFSPALIITILVIAVLMILLMTFVLKEVRIETSQEGFYESDSLEENNIDSLAIQNPFLNFNSPETYDGAYNKLLYESSTLNGSYIFTDVALIDHVLKLAEEERLAIDKARKKQKLDFFKYNFSDPYYKLRQDVNTLKYIKKHLIGKEIFLPDESSVMGGVVMSSSSFSLSSNDIFKLLLASLMQIIIIYGVAVASRTYSQEFRSGSVKMLMVRPITRNQLTSAKLLSVVTHSSLMYVALTAAIFITSMVMGTVSKVPTLFSFNAGAFSYVGAHMEMLYLWLINYVICVSWSVICFAISSILKNTTVGIMAYFILPIFSLPLHYIALDTIYLTSALNWGAFFNASGEYPIAIGSNFFITLALWVVYIGGLIALTYYRVNKRDLA